MEFTKADRVQCDNLLTTLKKGEYKLNGMEALAFGNIIKFVCKVSDAIDASIKQAETEQALQGAKVSEPPKEPKKKKKVAKKKATPKKKLVKKKEPVKSVTSPETKVSMEGAL
jgi:outer membrane biosynthesis protein TonB